MISLSPANSFWILVIASFCLQQTQGVELTVNGLKDAGFFQVDTSIPNITCAGDLGVERDPEVGDCDNQVNVNPQNDISVIDGNAYEGPNHYKIHPLVMTSYILFCEVDSEQACFAAMTYEVKLQNSSETELQCSLFFSAGDRSGSKDRRPSKVIWKKNNHELPELTKSLTAGDFYDVSADYSITYSKIFSVTSNVTIDQSNSAYPGEYQCSYIFEKQELPSDETILFTGAPEVSITFRSLTDDKEPQEEDDGMEKQYTDGNKIKLICQATGYPRPTVQWFHEGELVASAQEKSTADYVISTIAIDELDDQEHRGNYSCVADNGIESTERVKYRVLHARDRLAPLWPFIGIVVQVIVLAVVIAIGEKFRKKKLAEKHRRQQQQMLNDKPEGTEVST